MSLTIEPIAYVRTPYPTKFGVPRQPGLVDALESTVEFAEPYRNPDALRGLEGFDYLWLIWEFSYNRREPGSWSPTVRPPILGGTDRLGVFATRSSFRPNGLGLSSVRLLGVDLEAPYRSGGSGPALRVAGADMVDGTPVYDIKPYIVSSDSHPDASQGWRDGTAWRELEVSIPDSELAKVPHDLRDGLEQMLRQDPRPAYTRSGQEGRLFWVPLGELAIWFAVDGSALEVKRIDRLDVTQMKRLRNTGTIEGFDDGLLTS